MSNKLVKIFLFIIVVLGLMIFTSSVKAAGEENLKLNFTSDEPVDLKSTLFCAQHGYRTALFDENNNKQSYVEYKKSGEENEVEPSVGYALWKRSVDGDDYDKSRYSIQHTIWRSGNWGNSSNVLEDGSNPFAMGESTQLTPIDNENLEFRANDYGEVYYNIFKKIEGSDKQLFTSQTVEGDLKVLVDQKTGTYTVGPYKLNLAVDGASDASKQILYNELIANGNKGFTSANRFAKVGSIDGMNGTDAEFLDSKGNKIMFPNFVTGEEFFIRFKPNNDGAIAETGSPLIKVKWLKYTAARVIHYKPYKFSYYHRFSSSSSVVTYESHKRSQKYGYAKGTMVLKGKNGDSYTVTVKTGSVPIYAEEDDDGDVRYYLVDNNQLVEIDLEKSHIDMTIQKVNEIVLTKELRKEQEIPGEELKEKEIIKKTYDYDYGADWFEVKLKLVSKKINVKLGGHVWLEIGDVKTNEIDGKKTDKDQPFAGMLVQLVEANGTLVATTTTNVNGQYQFENLNPLKKYFVRFVYNGELYQSTFYKYDLSGGFSNAKDVEREAFNTKFVKIDSTPKNYKTDNWHKSYALETKLAQENGEYISFGEKALRYKDVWAKFLEFSTTEMSYDKAYIKVDEWMSSLSVAAQERADVINFIKDCMINAVTNVNDNLSGVQILYPVYDQYAILDENNPPENVESVDLDVKYFYLYTKKSDQSRYVDFGINERRVNQLSIQKDVYKARVIVNGKVHDFYYNKKDANMDDNGSWSIAIRAADELYNGEYTYQRELRKSEYLYNAASVGADSAKDLKVYVTYRIAVKNLGDVDTTVNEIVDYYDDSQYEFDGTLNGNTYALNSYNEYDANGNVSKTYSNTFVGDRNGNKVSDLTVKNITSLADREASKKLQNGKYSYNSLYLTGLKTEDGKDRFEPQDYGFAFVTFRVKNDEATGKVKLDQDLMNGNTTVGKRNIAEINGYSSYYSNGTTIPDYLDKDGNKVTANVSGKDAGIIDRDSRAGSLDVIDLTENGDLRADRNNDVNNRLEPDTDKAPNIKVVIETNPRDDRTFKGFTFEDARNVNKNNALVGNGVYNPNDVDANGNKDKLINGVTVELVELVQNVDKDGMPINSFRAEHVWSTMNYDINNKSWSENNERYFSGSGKSKVILNGNGILTVNPIELGNGEYGFNSIPAGDYFIRFKYGDNSQTVLKSDDNEVNNLIGMKGLNTKSYNGQDYKSTVYQAGVDQNGNYDIKGINGFRDYDKQNYVDALNKEAMYYYNIANSASVKNVSDAKDVYSYRERVNNYSKELVNNKSEILASFEKLGTYKADKQENQKNDQINMIKQLIDNTYMVAQTGVINTEVEYNRTETRDQGKVNNISYVVDDIDLGLVERPEVQLKLSKRVANFQLVLANGSTMFDTDKSVNNLYFSKHDGHRTSYKDGRMATPVVNTKNTKATPELVQLNMDDELMVGSSIKVTYELKVDNVGEIDYLDRQFYYTGVTNNPSADNVSKTNANQIIDYLSNMTKYNKEEQVTGTNWNTVTVNDVIASKADTSKIANDLVNRQYVDEVSTYNTLLTSTDLSGDLLPELMKSNSSKKTNLVVSTLVGSAKNADTLTYNNLSEIIKTSNTQGRRSQYSIVGNQEMADQSLSTNARGDVYSSSDLVTPSEIDADSAQKIVLLPPTGANRNYLPIVISVIAVSLLVMATTVIVGKVKYMNIA